MSTTALSTVTHYGHFIDGKQVFSHHDDDIDRINPATMQLVSRYAAGHPDDVDAAVQSAHTAFYSGQWSRISGMRRQRVLHTLADLMREHADELATLDSIEVGKPQRVARADVDGAIGLMDYAGSLAAVDHGDLHTNLDDDFTGLLIREPIGVIGAIVPWNFPLLILCQKVAFALAAGCSVVAKPSEFTSASAVRLAELAITAGVPAGIYNVVLGRGVVGQALAEHRKVDMVTFTGSTATGRRVLQAAQGNLKKTSLELGGKAAQIVCADADLDDAVAGVVFATVHNQGECCVAGTRLLVEDSIAEEFSHRLVERMKNLTVGGPESDADYGAMIHEHHLHQVLGAVSSAEQEGATVLTGGRQLTGGAFDSGYFMEPTVIGDVAPASAAFQQEIFGPVLAITRFHGIAEAVDLANDVVYGLGNTVWSKNIDTVNYAMRRLRSGTVWVNTTIDGAPQMSFGGYKESGYGREMGRAGYEEFTQLKAVQIRHGRRADSFGLRS